ncbi:MAG: phosphatase PAP2 family protein [Byssovorax sp.]
MRPITTPRSQLLLLSCVMAGAITLSGSARAADEPAVDPRAAAPAPTTPASTAPAAPAEPTPAASSTATPEKAPVPPLPIAQSPTSQKRAETLEPRPVYQPSTLGGSRLQADPIADGAVLGIAAGFGILSDMIISTGELRPQQISPTFSTSQLLGIDRIAVTQQVDPNARTLSNIGLYAALSYTLVDTIATGFREDSRQAALVDGIIYGEVLALTAGVTNLAKMAVRRPRPVAYIEAAAHKNDPDYSNADTDSSLSFFSGHAANCGAVAGAATYLAFTRSPHSIRPWLTLAGGALLTTFVGYERVRAGAHFPTDVIAGAGIGVLVAHLHREDTAKQRRVWIGFTPGLGTGGTLTLGGLL